MAPLNAGDVVPVPWFIIGSHHLRNLDETLRFDLRRKRLAGRAEHTQFCRREVAAVVVGCQRRGSSRGDVNTVRAGRRTAATRYLNKVCSGWKRGMSQRVGKPYSVVRKYGRANIRSRAIQQADRRVVCAGAIGGHRDGQVAR